jgi:anion-transporting  ArsA/GET3 family ATPase
MCPRRVDAPAQTARQEPRLLSRRLLVLTGKGGTGKSTLSAALALAAARRGKRVLVCEVTARERVSELFGRPRSGAEIRELAPNLHSVHIQPQEAMHQYAVMTLRSEALYRLVFERRIVRYFLEAAPSLAEIVMLGKVFWHATKDQERGRPRWDLVILDAPATGHGLSLLSVPDVFLRLVREGPLARDMSEMQALLKDPARTATCIVTLPEEMPANEAAFLHRGLEERGLPQGALFLNGLFATRFSAQERQLVARGGPLLAAAADAAEAHEARAELGARYERQLRAEVALPLYGVPQIFDRHFGVRSLEQVAQAIEGAL